MSRRKARGHVSHERWLISYADFITLLFAFFVVLFASSQEDKKRQAKVATSIQAAFNQMGMFEGSAKLPAAGPAPATGLQGGPAAVAVGPLSEEMEDVRRRIEAASQEISNGSIAVTQSQSGLTISLREAKFFDSGAADVLPSALPVLERIAAVLPENGLRVEGHTDDMPIHTAQFASNWELSSARASSVARLLLLHPNVSGERLSVSGYAEFHPVADNATADGRARNRRVDIVVLALGR